MRHKEPKSTESNQRKPYQNGHGQMAYQTGYQVKPQTGYQAGYQMGYQAKPQAGYQVKPQAVPQMGHQAKSQMGSQAKPAASQAELAQKELRHMSRAELLELLLAQAEENEKLRQQLKVAQQALADRRIGISQSGTMAEAALRLNGVFEAADKAARQYLENVQRTAWENRNRQ